MNHPFIALILSVLFVLLGASCDKQGPVARPRTQYVHLNLKNEPQTLDPRKGGDIISSHLHFLLFEGLVRLNADSSITPAQARSFEISPDGTVYTFHLRDSLWSNGTPVTAYDFETAWKDILDPAFPSPNAHLLYPIKNAENAKQGKVGLSEVGIQAKDEKTFIVTLEKPTPYFLDLISFCVFFPVNSKKDREVPQWAFDAGEDFVCNGPFILKEWKHNDEILAVKNPRYWDRSKTRPDAVHFSMIENEATALQLFENGNLDMVGAPLCALSVDAIAVLKKQGRLVTQPSGGTSIIAFNIDKPPFNNVKIRKALAYAINREELVKNITQMGEVAATNAVPPVLKNNHNRSFFQDGNSVLARALLEEGMQELGITREAFKEIVYFYFTSETNHKVAQAIQQQWQHTLGIEIKIENCEYKFLLSRLAKRDYTVGQAQWLAQYNDQMNILERFKLKTNPKNYPNWENPEYIRLLEQSFYENGTARAQTLEKAEEIFLDEMPICPLYHWGMTYVVQSHIKGPALTPIGDIDFDTLVPANNEAWR